MTIKVQRQSRGLLALLGAVGEQSPAEFLDGIQGHVDMTYLLSTGLAQSSAVSGGLVALNATVELVVPSNEHWLLLGAEGLTSGQVGLTGVGVLLELRIDSGTVTVCNKTWGTTYPLAVAGSLYSCTYQPSFPVIMSPGSRLRARLSALSGVATNGLDVRALYYRYTS